MGFQAGSIPIWPVTPDWTDGVQETLAWSTEVLRAESTATTYHRGLRLTPRRSFSFRVLAAAKERRIAAMLLAAVDGKWLLPIWPDVQCLAEGISIGTSTIPCQTAGRDFASGGKALIYVDVTNWHVVDVADITQSALQLAAPVDAKIAPGARLYPLRVATMTGGAEETHRSDDVSRRVLTFQVIEACAWPQLISGSPSYLGHPVVELRPDESTDPSSTVARLLQSIDFGTAQPFAFDPARIALSTRQAHWKLFGRDQHTWFRSLLYTLDGRRAPAWVPSWTADLLAVGTLAANSANLRIEWAGYTLFGLGCRNRRQLRIELHDGTVFYRRIETAVSVADIEILTLDSTLAPFAIPAGAIRLISFMALCTLASDEVEIQHVTDADGLAAATTAWQEVAFDVA